MTFPALERYAMNCGLLLLPAIVWNIALAEQLPPPFSAEEFWRDIPAPLTFAENTLRVAVSALPFFMPLNLTAPTNTTVRLFRTPAHKAGTSNSRSRTNKRALLIYATGTFAYFASWLALILFPTSSWSTSALGFVAPAYTPFFWLLGIALLGRQLFWGGYYRWWMYLVLALAFLATHISHTAIVYARVRCGANLHCTGH